jgi:hypothetical protein
MIICVHQRGEGMTYFDVVTKSAFNEAVSSSLDQMPKDNAKVVLPDGDIVIEGWGTGIEDFQRFKHIAVGDKIVDGRVSSY